MSLQGEEIIKKLETLSRSVEEHMKDLNKSREDCKVRVEHILNSKYHQEDVEEDLESFVEAYAMGRQPSPFTEQPQVLNIDKKLIRLRAQDTSEQRINDILLKIKVKNNAQK